MTIRILDEPALAHAMEQLRALDCEHILRMIEAAGHPPLRKRDDGFAGLAWIIISQQVSTASARAIFARVAARYEPLDHRPFLHASDEDLKSCGLSAPKMRTLRAVAQAMEDGDLDVAALAGLPPDAAIGQLTAIKGIGPWTAQIYLLFCLGHPDVWPSGDLALQEGVKLALGLRKRPDPKRLERISARWRPWRSVAARLVWHYYGIARPAAAPTAKPAAAKKPAKKPARKNAKKSAAKPPKTARKRAAKSKSARVAQASRQS